MVWRLRVIFFKKTFEIYGSRFIRRSRSVLRCFDFSFSVRLDKRVDVLLAAATEHKPLAFR